MYKLYYKIVELFLQNSKNLPSISKKEQMFCSELASRNIAWKNEGLLSYC